METTAAAALTELLAQHEELRAMMERCEQLADEVDAARASPGVLLQEVAHLRVAFEKHNQYEEKLLRPILRGAAVLEEVRMERMVADHIEEHRATGRQLAGPTAELRATMANLRNHLATEERYFSRAGLARDDVFVVEGDG